MTAGKNNNKTWHLLLTVVDKGALHIFIGQLAPNPGDKHRAGLVWVHTHGCKNCQDTGMDVLLYLSVRCFYLALTESLKSAGNS